MVQEKDVAAGEQVAVSVVDCPLLIVEGDAANVQVGGWFTVIVTEAEAPVPAALVPLTAYVVSEVGETLPLGAAPENPVLVQL